MHLQTETISLLALLSLTLAALRFWLRVQQLEKKLDRVTKGLLQLVDESESATNELRQSLSGLAERSKDAVQDSTSSVPASADGLDSSDPWDIDRRHRVLTLARRGLAAREIAHRLCLPDGEVELMLRLSRQTAS